MGSGSIDAVQDAEEAHREASALLIAEIAAPLVAAGGFTRDEAVEKATEYVRATQAAEDDVTGALGTLAEAQLPTPGRSVRVAQIAAIARELQPAARRAADTL